MTFFISLDTVGHNVTMYIIYIISNIHYIFQGYTDLTYIIFYKVTLIYHALDFYIKKLVNFQTTDNLTVSLTRVTIKRKVTLKCKTTVIYSQNISNFYTTNIFHFRQVERL